MAQGIGWLDRLRIERFVWTLDQRIYDLPRASRIARRREVRDNLLAAAVQVGTTKALRGLGSSRRLAGEYLDAELGEGPRHSWLAAAYFAGLVPLLMLFGMGVTESAYRDGITAVDPHASGTFTWHGIDYLQTAVTFTFVDGNGTRVGGAWTPLTYAIWLLGTILVGRLWRLLPGFRRDR
jgi:hypothetical protein